MNTAVRSSGSEYRSVYKWRADTSSRGGPRPAARVLILVPDVAVGAAVGRPADLDEDLQEHDGRRSGRRAAAAARSTQQTCTPHASTTFSLLTHCEHFLYFILFLLLYSIMRGKGVFDRNHRIYCRVRENRVRQVIRLIGHTFLAYCGQPPTFQNKSLTLTFLNLAL